MKTIILILTLLLTSSFNTNDDGCLQLDIMLVADISSSVNGSENFINEALTAFVTRFDLSEDGIKIGFIKFCSAPFLMNSLTTNKYSLFKSISTIKLESSYGTTNMSGALFLAADELMQYGRPSTKKIVIVISDGEPDRIDETREAALLLKAFGETSICGVFVAGNIGKDLMKEISSPYCYVESDYNNLVNELKKLDICL